MLAIALSWCYVFLTSMPIGLGLHLLYSRVVGENINSRILPVDYYVILGLIAITTFLGYCSLFYKIGLVSNIIIIIPSAIILGYNYKRITKQKSVFKLLSQDENAILFIVVIFVMIYAALSPKIYDSGLYYEQAIQWINKYRTVPGLGNLHGRFAFNSHFFLISGFYDFYFLNKVDPIYSLNSFLFLMLAIRSLSSVFINLRSNKHYKLMIHLLILVSSLWLFRRALSSPAPDMGVAILIIYLFLIYISNNASFTPFANILLISLILILPTFKLSTVWVLILIPFLYYRKLNRRNLILILGLSVIILLPFLIRNIILSGYLVYPFASIDLFSFDWKIPVESVVRQSFSVENWAKTVGHPPAHNIYIPFDEWVSPWLKSLRPDALLLLIINLLSPLVLLFWRKYITNKKYYVINLVSLINIFFCLFTAPSLRFIYGFLIFNMSLTVGIVFMRFHNFNISRVIYKIVVNLILLISIIINVHWSQKNLHGISSKNLLLPISTKKIEVKEVALGTVRIKLPVSGDRCYNTPLPCTPYYKKNLRLRGDNISDGFKIDEGH